MPRTIDPNQSVGSYQFSQVNLRAARDKGVDKFTIVTIAVDASGSVDSFGNKIEACVKTIFEACQKSPFCHNLIVRLIKFNSRVTDIHGFKLLSEINFADYDGFLKPGGMTALFDAADNSVRCMKDQAELLIKDNDYDINGCLYLISDGMDNNSTISRDGVRVGLQGVISAEIFKSFITVLIGVNTQSSEKERDSHTGNYLTVSEFLQSFKDEAGLTQYVEVENADAKSLARLANFISKSVSASASGKANVGNGPNPNLTLTI